jgi:thioredoxin
MKNTFLGIVFLSVVWLSSCGGSATPETKPASATTASNITSQAGSNNEVQPENNTTAVSSENGAVIQLTNAIFLEKVYDYKKDPKKWSYKGDKPCIIDFYADWCKPCKMVAPILEELSGKYKGQVVIYKVNVDQERELAGFFGIRSIPTVFFCPAQGDPQMAQGALPKESYEKAITDILLNKK